MTTNLPSLPKLRLRANQAAEQNPAANTLQLISPSSQHSSNPYMNSLVKVAFDSFGFANRSPMNSRRFPADISPKISKFEAFHLETPPSEINGENNGQFERLDSLSVAWWFNDNAKEEAGPARAAYESHHEDVFVAPDLFCELTTGDQLADCSLAKRKSPHSPKPMASKKTRQQKLAELKSNFEQESVNTSVKSKKAPGCSCQRSRCVRLHCKCFRVLGYCGPECGCKGCFNTPEFETQRQFVIDKTRQIFDKAFEPKVAAVGGTMLNSQGCRCKTGCQKNYCDCFRGGSGCSPICRCVACLNAQVKLNPEEVRAFYEPALRSKNKIVIEKFGSDVESKEQPQTLNDLESQKTGEPGCRAEESAFAVSYQTYKRPKYQCAKKVFRGRKSSKEV